MSSLLAAVLAVGLTAVWAAEAPKSSTLPGDAIELKTADGWALKARYLQGQDPSKPVAVLLHGRGMRKEWWLRLAKALAKAGHGYLAVDLRGHGESQTAPDGQTLHWRKMKATRVENDYESMANDVQAAVAHLATDNVPESRIALIGQDVGGSVALKYAAVHPDVALLVMLAPGLKYQEVTTVNAMRAYKNRPVLMVYGELDKTASREAPILFQFAKMTAGADKAAVVSVPNVPGGKLLTGAVTAQIVDWLSNPAPPAPVEASSGAAQDLGGEPPAAEDEVH